MAVLVLLNNWFHDLSVAVLTCALLGLSATWRAAVGADPAVRPLLTALDRTGVRLAWAGAAGVLGFGVVRTAAFREYEWLPAAGKGILVALAVKHAVLASAVAFAVVAAVRTRARGRAALAEAAR